jgi:hypothetical protein
MSIYTLSSSLEVSLVSYNLPDIMSSFPEVCSYDFLLLGYLFRAFYSGDSSVTFYLNFWIVASFSRSPNDVLLPGYLPTVHSVLLPGG